MRASATEFVLGFILIVSCGNEILSTPRTKFSFKKTFVTPTKTHQERLAELDQCEILERSNFSSDEDDDKHTHPQKTPKIPKAVANAQIHVRFGEDSTELDRKEVFIEEESKRPSDQSPSHQEKPQWAFPAPPCSYQGFPPPSPYNPYYPFWPYGPPAPFPGHPGSYNPYSYNPYGPYFNPHTQSPPAALKEDHHESKDHHVKPGKDNEYFKQNIFQIVKFKNENKAETTTPKTPFVYFYNKDKCGRKPTLEEIRNQPPSVLTSQELALIDKYLNSDELEGSGRDEEHPHTDHCTTKKPTIQGKATTTCAPKPSSSSSQNGSSTTRPSAPGCHEKTTVTPVSKPTCPHLTKPPATSTTKTTTQNPSTLKQTTTKKATKPTTKSPCREPQTTRGCPLVTTPTPPPSPCVETQPPSTTKPFQDIILDQIINPPACSAKPSNDSLKLSDNLNFIKVNLSDITSGCPCNASNEEGDLVRETYDVGDLLRVKTRPESAWLPYGPYSPYGWNNPFGGNVGGFYPPWFLPQNSPWSPGFFGANPMLGGFLPPGAGTGCDSCGKNLLGAGCSQCGGGESRSCTKKI